VVVVVAKDGIGIAFMLIVPRGGERLGMSFLVWDLLLCLAKVGRF
jgi:hypothetical protein